MVEVTSISFPHSALKKIYEFLIMPAYGYMLLCGILCGGTVQNRNINEEDVIKGDED